MQDTGVRAASPAAADRDALRRQPAEGAARPVPLRVAEGPASRRADARHRPRRARRDLRAAARASRAEGFGIVLCSSEMSEILTQCHRVAGLPRGPRRGGASTATRRPRRSILAAASGTRHGLARKRVAPGRSGSGEARRSFRSAAAEAQPAGAPDERPRPRRRRHPLDRVLARPRRPAGLSRHRQPDRHPPAGGREGDPRGRHDGRDRVRRHRPVRRLGARAVGDADGLVPDAGGFVARGDRRRRSRGRGALWSRERLRRRRGGSSSPSSPRSR